MTNPMPLPPPQIVGDDPKLYFKMSRMSPEQIRAFVCQAAEDGAFDYAKLYGYAAHFLGPQSPEAGLVRGSHTSEFPHITIREQSSKTIVTILLVDYGNEGGFFAETRGTLWVGENGSKYVDRVIRTPERGFLEAEPSAVEVAAMHEVAAARIRAEQAAEKAKAEAAQVTSLST